MPAPHRPTSTAVGFRRNIKWFLGALVGFLITLILILLVLLQTALNTAAQKERDSRRIAFEAAKASIEAAGPDLSATAIDGRLVALRASLGLAGATLEMPDGRVIRSGRTAVSTETIARSTSQGTLTLYFQPSTIGGLQQRFMIVAAIVLGSTIVALILLVLLLPRIVRPIDRMLEDAQLLGERDLGQAEDHYLVETFRSSIDKLREQEQELRRLHEFEKARADDLERITATLTRSLSAGFIALDPQGNVVDLNRAAREILQLPPDSETPGPLRDVLGPGPFCKMIERVFGKRESLSRFELVDESRSLVVGLTTVPLYGEDRSFVGMLVLFTDLSSVRQLEERMREMQALADLGQISAGIAHELRNSLGTILGYLKLARRQDDEQKTDLKILQAAEEGQRLSESINALLAFARPVSPELEQVDIRELLTQTASRLTSERDDVEITIDGNSGIIEGDRSLLETVFENLFRNAIEAMTVNGTGLIGVTVESAGEEVRVSVTDNGTGIEPDLLPRVFLPFQTGKASGTGLGLALARKIILLHDGAISIESERGHGTTVTIELPVRR